jgi:hypothetical protein
LSVQPHSSSCYRWAGLATLLSTSLWLWGCGTPWELRRQPAAPLGIGQEARQDPALSGDGRLLASVAERGGRSTVILQERSSGKVLPLRHLRRQQPHSSPSLSWNGRYLALVVQQGPQRQAVIEDRANGQLHPLLLPAGREPQRLSLAPDARRVVLEVLDNGQSRVEVFDLSGLLEPDQAPGQPVSGGGGLTR